MTTRNKSSIFTLLDPIDPSNSIDRDAEQFFTTDTTKRPLSECDFIIKATYNSEVIPTYSNQNDTPAVIEQKWETFFDTIFTGIVSGKVSDKDGDEVTIPMKIGKPNANSNGDEVTLIADQSTWDFQNNSGTISPVIGIVLQALYRRRRPDFSGEIFELPLRRIYEISNLSEVESGLNGTLEQVLSNHKSEIASYNVTSNSADTPSGVFPYSGVARFFLDATNSTEQINDADSDSDLSLKYLNVGDELRLRIKFKGKSDEDILHLGYVAVFS